MITATQCRRRIDFSALDRHPQPLRGVGHEASKPRERPTRTRSAPTREKRHRRGMRGVLANRPISLLKGSPSAGRPLRKCHWPGYPLEQALQQAVEPVAREPHHGPCTRAPDGGRRDDQFMNRPHGRSQSEKRRRSAFSHAETAARAPRAPAARARPGR